MVKSVLEKTLDEMVAYGQVGEVSSRLAGKFGKALAARRIAVARESEPRKTRKQDRKSETLGEPTIDRLERMLAARYWTGQQGTWRNKQARVTAWHPAEDGIKEHATVDLMVEDWGLMKDQPFVSFTKRVYFDE